jgi:NAD(P)-dependent dehydrogenase (short-subunit alcohol dehydrogenase family)
MLALDRGTHVVVVGRDQPKLDTAVRSLGSEARGFAVDAQDRAALNEYFRELAPFDHLVLTASGGRGAGSFRDLDADGLRAGFEAKFWTYWSAAQAALATLRPTGSITFVTAASSRLANPGTSGLAAVNGALGRMVPTLARELAPLRINAVSPGVIDGQPTVSAATSGACGSSQSTGVSAPEPKASNPSSRIRGVD